MAMPKSIRKQAEKAQEITDALTASQQPAPEPTTPAEPDPAPSPSPAPEPAPAPADWEQRYRTLQGKYDSQVPALQGQVQQLTSQLTHLTSKLEAFTATPPAPEPQVSPVTDREREMYGEDLIDVIKRQATEVASTMTKDMQVKLTTLEKENKELRDQLQGVSGQQADTREQQYLGSLSQLVPDWQTINRDPRFHEWLTTMDDLGGVPRQAYLDSAYNAKDVQRTAKIFSTFKQTLSPTPAPSAPQPTVNPLERQVAPNSSRATAPEPGTSAVEKVWSRGEVTKFYQDVMRGKYRGREADQARIENEITAAAAAGRVKG